MRITLSSNEFINVQEALGNIPDPSGYKNLLRFDLMNLVNLKSIDGARCSQNINFNGKKQRKIIYKYRGDIISFQEALNISKFKIGKFDYIIRGIPRKNNVIEIPDGFGKINCE